MAEFLPLEERARLWLSGDPDEETRRELERLLTSRDEAALVACFEPELTFGTAGLRGAVGAGPARMNRAVVTRVAWGLARFLSEEGLGRRPVVVGYDARPDSARFAEETAEVLAGAGVSVRLFEEPCPTPLVAFACRALHAAAAVVVTASHNPRGDSGYKVYDDRGVQIVAPWDARIAALMAQAPPAASVPRSRAHVTAIEADIVDDYFARVTAAVATARTVDAESTDEQDAPSPLRVAYTPLHGVGLGAVRRVLGFAVDLRVVASQAAPDGTFPTTPFPNPEEPGVVDEVVALAREHRCELALANDPDADRLAVCVPGPDDARTFRMLSGDELGVLLADALLDALPAVNERGFVPVIAASVVSSPFVEAVARARGARVARTLTGFKWLCRVSEHLSAEERFVFAYEEALGYAVLPELVADKDGVSAARLVVERARALARRGRTLESRLSELFVRHGLWVSAPQSVRLAGPHAGERMRSALAQLRARPPRALAGLPVTRVVDYLLGAEERPVYLGSQDLVALELGDGGLVFLRPSGTEPKLKLYVHLTASVHGAAEIPNARSALAARGAQVGEALTGLLDLA